MKVSTSLHNGFQSVASELLIVGSFENEFPYGGAGKGGALACLGCYSEINNATGGRPLLVQADAEGFSGKVGQTFVHLSGRGNPAPRVLMVGLGSREKFNLDALRRALTSAFKEVKARKIANVMVAPVAEEAGAVTPEAYGEAVALYAGLVDYVINHKKTKRGGHKPEAHLKSLTVLTSADNDKAIAAGLKAGKVLAESVNFARDLSNMPAGELTPRRLAAYAEKVAKRSGGAITCELYRGKQLKKLGARALLAVAQGSAEEPVLIELTYTPKNAGGGDVLGLVGKSVTFDSGGLDIKNAEGMRTMKRDMAGGAAVLAAIAAIAALRLPVAVKAVLAATENMPDGAAYKPGDVIKTMAGLTVEVDNTDAEGRLTLADAIEFSKRRGVTRIVDLATLTGAVRSITHDVGAAAFGNKDEFTAAVASAAQAAGERVVAMPMWEEFRSANHTDIADLKNSGGDPGSITAAWFLREFAGEETPWVHLDIAGCSYRTRELGADPKGSTGWGVRTLVELARRLSR